MIFGFEDRAGDSAGLCGARFHAVFYESDPAEIGWSPCSTVPQFVPHEHGKGMSTDYSPKNIVKPAGFCELAAIALGNPLDRPMRRVVRRLPQGSSRCEHIMDVQAICDLLVDVCLVTGSCAMPGDGLDEALRNTSATRGNTPTCALGRA
jgi:hypothetical protein